MFRMAETALTADMYDFALFTEGPVAQWIRHRPTEPGIAGSSPAGVIGYGMVPHQATPSRAGTHDPALLLIKIAIRQTRDVCLVGLSGALCPKALR